MMGEGKGGKNRGGWDGGKSLLLFSRREKKEVYQVKEVSKGKELTVSIVEGDDVSKRRKKRGSREAGINPRALGTNPRSGRQAKRDEARQKLQRKVEALGFANYGAYLASPHWAEVRAAFRAVTPAHCIACKRSDVRLQIHHKAYKRLGCEDLSDLAYVCGSCHKEIHFSRGMNLEVKTGRVIKWHKNLKIQPVMWPPSTGSVPTMSRVKGPNGEWGPWETEGASQP